MPDNMGTDSMKQAMAGESKESAMIPKSICPDMNLKPGDDITLKVKNIQGDMLEVEYYTADEVNAPKEMTPEDLQKPGSEDKLKGMSSDQMRNSLPKADREY